MTAIAMQRSSATIGSDRARPQTVLAEAERLLATGDPDDYCAGMKRLIELAEANPQDCAVQFAVGRACCAVRDFDLAYRYLKQCVVLAPDEAAAWRNLALCLLGRKQDQAARIAIERAILLQPLDAGSYIAFAQILSFGGDAATALEACSQAVALAGDQETLVRALIEQGRQLQALGDIEAARAAFRRVLDVDPGCCDAIFQLAALRTPFDDPDTVVAALGEVAASGRLDEERRSQAEFAIGDILARETRFDEAFPHYAAGNRIRRARSTYDHAGAAAVHDRLIDAFRPELFREMADLGDPTERPVFIVGMPRSGTTLTEAMLAAHPAVAARGERYDMTRIVEMISIDNKRTIDEDGNVRPLEGLLRYPEELAEMHRDGLRQLRDGYLEALAAGAPDDALRLTDKMPQNFVHLGLIALFFPKAKIVHCVRDAMDTCVSCFTQNFTDEAAYSYDLADLGRYWREYARLMAHWKEVLPNPILELRYEELVADPEAAGRRLVDHLGLDWHAACLDFHRSGYETRTASLYQVRQPIYRSSVGRWRRYERFLAPLQAALAGA